MAGPAWTDDDQTEAPLVAANCAALLGDMAVSAAQRLVPTSAHAAQWHARIYAGCAPPSRSYVGNFRGDPAHPDLTDYEVGVGATLADGLPEKVGVWARDVAAALAAFDQGIARALTHLDPLLPVGQRPVTADELAAVVALTAEVHGEWVRMHPHANGNGRTARLWAAFVALRYGLPVFVRLKPRPVDVAYARAAKRSMGRPPDFRGDHGEAAAVFAHLLALSLLP